MSDVSV